MSLIDFFIRKPIISIVIMIIICFAGLVSFYHLPLRLFPKIVNPIINIGVNYPGASPAGVQTFVTNIVEQSLSGLQNVDYITANSSQGHCEVKVHMRLGENSNNALIEIVQRISTIVSALPKSVDSPIISKTPLDNNPILLFAFTSQQLTNAQTSEYLRRSLKPVLQSITGVASAQVMADHYSMKIKLSPELLAGQHVSASAVVSSLRRSNVQSTVGELNGVATHFPIYLAARLTTSKEFSHDIIKNTDNKTLYLTQLGKVALEPKNNKQSTYFNGHAAVMLAVKLQSGANPLLTIHNIMTLLPSIKRSLPQSLHMTTVVNAARFIKSSIYEVVVTLLCSIAIVALVIYLFLGSIRLVLVPLVSIPICIIGACSILLYQGYSINLLTLLAMVLAIGLVVDDAIVVMENIDRHFSSGSTAQQAALDATREISLPIVAMTLTSTVVFLPIAFAHGLSAMLFTEFSLTIAAMVLLSGVVALILTPMMCQYLMSGSVKKPNIKTVVEKSLQSLVVLYRSSLVCVFRHQKIIIGLWLLLVISCPFLYLHTHKEMAPIEDEGLLQVSSSAADASTTKFLRRGYQRLHAIYADMPQLQSSVSLLGTPGP